MPALTICPSEELVLSAFASRLAERGSVRLRAALEREVNLVTLSQVHSSNVRVRSKTIFPWVATKINENYDIHVIFLEQCIPRKQPALFRKCFLSFPKQERKLSLEIFDECADEERDDDKCELVDLLTAVQDRVEAEKESDGVVLFPWDVVRCEHDEIFF